MRMKKQGHYVAYCDNGHDYYYIEFYSWNRLHSKGNLDDAKNAILKLYGWTRYKTTTITSIERCDWE